MIEYINSFQDFNIIIPPGAKPDAKGNVYAICPQCEPYRKKKGQKKLSVHLERSVWNCHHCSWTGGLTPKSFARNKVAFDAGGLKDLNKQMIEYFNKRGVSLNTLISRRVKSAVKSVRQRDGSFLESLCLAFVYMQNNWTMMVKYRDRGKNFRIDKSNAVIPWGLDWIKDEKECIIVEGEIDCLSYHEVGLSNVVSTPVGAQISQKERKQFEETGMISGETHLKLSYFDACYEYFENKEIIYIATDDDPPGIKLRAEIGRRFGYERCRFIRFAQYEYTDDKDNRHKCNDPNDVLRYLGPEALRDTLDEAESFPILDVVYVGQVWDEILEQYNKGLEKGLSTGYANLDAHFTWMIGHIVGLNGYNNMGKTIFAINLMMLTAMMYNWSWGIYCPENYPIRNLLRIMVEIYTGKTIDKEKVVRATIEEINQARSFLSRHFYFVNNDDGYTPKDLEHVTKRLIQQHGIVGIYKDPWNALIHKTEGNLDLYLERVLSDEQRFAVNNNIINLIALHPPTPIREDKKNPEFPSIYQITGGAVWSKKLYEVMTIHRLTSLDKDENTVAQTAIHVNKTKDWKTIGRPTILDNRPVLVGFKPESNRCINSDGSDPFDIIKGIDDGKKTQEDDLNQEDLFNF